MREEELLTATKIQRFSVLNHTSVVIALFLMTDSIYNILIFNVNICSPSDSPLKRSVAVFSFLIPDIGAPTEATHYFHTLTSWTNHATCHATKPIFKRSWPLTHVFASCKLQHKKTSSSAQIIYRVKLRQWQIFNGIWMVSYRWSESTATTKIITLITFDMKLFVF